MGSHSVTMTCNGESHNFTSRDAAEGATPGVRSAKSSKFEEGE